MYFDMAKTRKNNFVTQTDERCFKVVVPFYCIDLLAHSISVISTFPLSCSIKNTYELVLKLPLQTFSPDDMRSQNYS